MVMKRSLRTVASASFLTFAAASVSAVAASVPITVDATKPGHAVSPSLWGLFFEDINLSADGGLYGELIRNRSFEDADKPEPWTLVTRGGGEGRISITEEQPMTDEPGKSFNRRALRIDILKAGQAAAGGGSKGG